MIVLESTIVALGSLLAGDVNPQGPDPTDINPGFVGFLATFGLVLATIALFFSMTRHLRKVDYAERRRKAGETGDAAAQARVDQGNGQQPGERAEESGLESPGAADNGDEERDRPAGRA